MPAGCARKARDLAAHRHRIEARLQRISNGAAQRANFPDTRRRHWAWRLKHAQPCGLQALLRGQYSTARACDSATWRRHQNPPKHADTCKLLIYKDFCCSIFQQSVPSTVGAGFKAMTQPAYPQSYPQILWVSGTCQTADFS
jgi:hypothetical protein